MNRDVYRPVIAPIIYTPGVTDGSAWLTQAAQRRGVRVKIVKFIASAAVALTLAAGSAEAGEWFVVSAGSDLIVGVDRASIRPDPILTRSRKSVWAVFVYRDRTTVGPYQFDYSVVRYSIDCNRMATAIGTLAYYQIGNDRPVNSVSGAGEIFEDSLPDSHAYNISDAACNNNIPGDIAPITTVNDFTEMTHSILQDTRSR